MTGKIATASEKVTHPIAAADHDNLNSDVSPGDIILSASHLSKSDLGIVHKYITGALTAADLNLSSKVASNLTLTVQDPGGSFGGSVMIVNPKSGKVRRSVRTEVAGYKFALVQNRKTRNLLSMTFEDLVVNNLRQDRTPRKAARGTLTLAAWLKSIVHAAAPNVHFVCPDLSSGLPPSSSANTPSQGASDRARAPGAAPSSKYKVKGGPANATQARLIETVIKTLMAQDGHLPPEVLYAALMAATQESTWSVNASNSGHLGLFQMSSDKGTEAQLRDPVCGAKWFFDIATRHYSDSVKAGSPLTPAEIALATEVPGGSPSQYGQWEAEAIANVVAYEGGGPSGATPAADATNGASDPAITAAVAAFIAADGVGKKKQTARDKFAYSQGAPYGPDGEDVWACLQRYAADLGYYCFGDSRANSVYFLSVHHMMASRPRLTLSEDQDTVDWIDYDCDTGKTADTAHVTCRAGIWIAPPGTVVGVEKSGAANGRWVVDDFRRSLYQNDATIDLGRRTAAPHEVLGVASQTGSVADAEPTSTTAAGKLAAIVAAARREMSADSGQRYGHERPIASSLFSGHPIMDCSEFVVLCYKAAGAPSPHGDNFIGAQTGTMIARGKKTETPTPGDICYYGPGNGPSGSPQHCTLYVGDGKCIGMGNHGITENPANAAIGGAFIGYYTGYVS